MSKATSHYWQSAWIIGASSGIGRELALQLSPVCKSVCASARSLDKLDELSTSKDNLYAYQVDVTNSNGVIETFGEISKAHTQPDLVVISSGLWDQVNVADFDPSIFRNGMEVNYMGVIHVLNACVAAMVEKGKGHIAIVSSVSGYRGLPNAAAYSPSKAALINLAESIAPQLAQKGVTITIVNPGFVDTPMTSSNKFPMPFIMSAKDAASTIISGLKNNKFEIAFPKKLAWGLNFLRILPNSVFFWIVRKFILRS